MVSRSRAAESCTGKQALQRDVAQRVALRQRQRELSSAAYRCEVCGAWHVGQSIAPRKSRRVEP